MIYKSFVRLLAATALVCGCAGPAPVSNVDAVMDNILSRKSVRSYTDQKLTEEQINTLLRAAMATPSGSNVQPWSFVVLTDPSDYETVFAGNFNMDKFKQSAAVFVLCADTTVTRTPRGGGEPVVQPNGTWRDDLGAATENLLLAAESLGLGAVWTASYPYEDRMTPAIEALALPDNVKPYCIVPIGHPAGDDKPKDKWKPENIHYDKW